MAWWRGGLLGGILLVSGCGGHPASVQRTTDDIEAAQAAQREITDRYEAEYAAREQAEID